MHLRAGRSLAMVAALLLPSSFASASVINGSFETPDVGGPGAGNYSLVVPGGSSFPGWQTGPLGSVAIVDVPDFNSEFGTGLNAYDGDQVVDLNLGFIITWIQQDIATTAGQAYDVFFAYLLDPQAQTSSSGLAYAQDVTSATIIESVSFQHDGTGGWRTGALTFTATSDLTRLVFQSNNPVPFETGGIWLDAVSVNPAQQSAVPEPASLALMGLGSIGVLCGGYRKRKARK